MRLVTCVIGLGPRRVVVATLLVGACAADPTSVGSRNDTHQAGGRGATEAEKDGPAAFGNAPPAAGASATLGSPAAAGTGSNLADPSICVVGQFCGPTTPDPDNCGTLTLEGDTTVTEVPGNVLMVFDRSSSMNQDWNGMMRWQAAGGAMLSALMPLQDKLTIGAVFFPDNTEGFGMTCTVDPITDADQIAFMPGAMALEKMQAAAPSGTPTPLYSSSAMGTPTLEGLQAADAALAAATLKGITSVILVTDGDPNCAWDEAMATGIVSGWAARGIKTYVLGVPGVGGGGVATLNAVAMAGGTDQYIAPTDAATLATTIGEIVEETVTTGIDSCTITFDQPAAAPDKLALAVMEAGVEAAVPHTYPDGTAAWTISDDGTTVELLGNTCAAAMNGTYESLRFVFGCVELPPADPPPGPE
jgi:hypothetical protein